MKIELITTNEAYLLRFLIHSELFKEGHGAFGEADNSYRDFIYIGNIKHYISETDFILYDPEYKCAIQVISNYNASDKCLELMNPKELIERKNKKYERFLEFKKEIESDIFYKPKATGLSDCPFMYCDKNPKCEDKCRYK